MKIRNGFVSNSSSSSFIIDKNKITDLQKSLIYNHIEKAESMFKIYSYEGDRWDIYETEDQIAGYTFMNNFNMCEFFEKIGINPEDVEWDED